MDSTAARTLWAAAATLLAALTIFTLPASIARGSGFVRPKGASPYRTSLVPLYERCARPGTNNRPVNTVHGPGLTDANGNQLGACKDPELISGMLTHGTPDVNAKAANAMGFFVMAAKPGNSSTPEDEADVRVSMSLTDVRLQRNLADYTGELQLSLDTRITDAANGPGLNDAATMKDFYWEAAVPCTATSSSAIGATCALTTTVDALIPGTITEGKRTVWEQHDHIHVFDGGEDMDADTEDDHLLFAVQGVYVP